MSLLDLVPEVRLQIYEQLLVDSDPIAFDPLDYDSSSNLVWSNRWNRLHPAILRVCRLIHEEAAPILYSYNRFQFPEVCSIDECEPNHAHFTPFFRQIGGQAGLIRHICIPFPTLIRVNGSVQLHAVHNKTFDTLRTETNVKTLELSIYPEHSILNMLPDGLTSLETINRHFKTWNSLREVVIIVEQYPGSDANDDLLPVLAKTGWQVKVKMLSKRVWISCDDRVEFDNEEDCREYDEEQLRVEEMLHDAKERSLWHEYYDGRRDPYRRNDSDYD